MKHTFPPEFDRLTPEQLTQVDAWLDAFQYRIVRQKLLEHFQITISVNKLCRYNQNREIAAELSDDTLEIGARQIYQMLNAEPVPYHDATLHVIEQRTFQQVLRRDLTVNKLVSLHKLATYKQRLSLDQRRLAITERRLGLTAPKPRADHADRAAADAVPSVPSRPTPRPEPATPATPPPPAPEPNVQITPVAAKPASAVPPPFQSQKYSAPPSAAERLVASQSIVLPDLREDFLLEAKPGATPLASTLTSLMKELPETPIPFPSIYSKSHRLAA